MREIFLSVYWSMLPPEYQPLELELLSLGLALNGIPAEELSEHALRLVDEDPDPDLAQVAAAQSPTLEHEGELFAKYLVRRGFGRLSPKDAALRMSALLARAACSGCGQFSYLQTAQEMIENWTSCTGAEPFTESSEVPSEIRALWREIEYNHSLLVDRLGTYPSPYQLARESNHGLERFMKQFLERASTESHWH